MVPLVVVLVVSDGMIQGITSRYIEAGTYHLQAEPQAVMDLQDLEGAASALRLKADVAAFPEFQGYGMAISGSKSTGVMIRAVDPAFLEDSGTAMYLKASKGEARLISSNQILLGDDLARQLDAKVGDTIGIVTSHPDYGYKAGTFEPKLSIFRVRGIVSAGYRELDAMWAFVSVGAVSRVFAPGNSRALIGIKVVNPYGDLEPSRAAAKSALSGDWSVTTWPEAERNIYKSFSTTRALLLLVMTLAVAVAAINIGSALVMLVLERRRDIAILKSAGASPRQIGQVFVLTGLVLGGSGTILGIGLGSILAWRINDLIACIELAINAGARLRALLIGGPLPREAMRLLDPAYYLERIPVHLRLGELAIITGLSLILCFLASLVPAGRASRLPPLEIFRKT
jgi:lipoprotein-releasing system permease protein